jgi:hypothetical protein
MFGSKGVFLNMEKVVGQVEKGWPGQVISLRTSRRPRQGFLLYRILNKGNDVRQVSKHSPGQVISLRTPGRPRQGFCSTEY